ncbi:hypothetical protein CC2G_012405 [Coprinopsis cinerea AmutBmut pab1-1]|nr:hypothetical protein CC2G_012405 [Coprinopsis cinerea AmutBmut pab1-1]
MRTLCDSSSLFIQQLPRQQQLDQIQIQHNRSHQPQVSKPSPSSSLQKHYGGPNASKPRLVAFRTPIPPSFTTTKIQVSRPASASNPVVRPVKPALFTRAPAKFQLSKKEKKLYIDWLDNALQKANENAGTSNGVTMSWGKDALTAHDLNTAFKPNCRVYTMKPREAYIAQLRCPDHTVITSWIEITPGTEGEAPSASEVLEQLKAKLEAAS